MDFYSSNYRNYVFLPLFFLVVFLLIIFVYPGLKLGIDLKGGTNIIVRADTPFDVKPLITKLNQKFSLSDLQVTSIQGPNGNGIFIQFSQENTLAQAKNMLDLSKKNLESNPAEAKRLSLESIKYSASFLNETPKQDFSSEKELYEYASSLFAKAENHFDLSLQQIIKETYGLQSDLKYQKTQVGPTLGKEFYNASLAALFLGLLFLSIVIIIYFREILTAATIIAAAIFNILGSLALMSIFGINVSLTTIPALLMIIGYSVDSEIVVSARVLKRKEESARKRLLDSIKTILTMSFTAIAAVTSLVVFSYFSQISVLFEISIVLLFGLLADILSSTMLNAPFILAKAEKEEKV
ncbi:MAG: hypothetical protein QXX06_01415 [Candidatus Diapherotrites archaeon]